MTVPVMYGRTVLTGGGAGALDAIDGTGLIEGDMCIVVTSTYFYLYYLNATSATAESSPGIISPDTNAGDKRWHLSGCYQKKYLAQDLSITGNGNIGSLYAPNLPNGSRLTFIVGRTAGNNDNAYIGFIPNATADQSLITFGQVGAADKLVIRGDGDVGIGTTSPAHKLHIVGTLGVYDGLVDIEEEVEAQTGYFWGNISVESITDRTPHYEGDAIAELAKIKGKDGKIDHDSLPVFARKAVKKAMTITEKVTKTKEMDGKIEEYQENETRTIQVDDGVGRDLGAMISMLTKAVQQLTERIQILENKE